MNALRWIGMTGIIAIAVMRCCIVFAPQLVFDSDPVFDSASPSALGMGGSLFLDVALLIACVFALVGEWRTRRGLDPLLLTLALLPLPVILWHARNDAGDMWRGSTWLAAAIACVAIAHLARDKTMRIIITASLIAVIVPLLLRGASQMTVEHDATVAAYQQSKPEFLQARGWDPDSPAARIYERRLMHREPIGWFPSTNIYGSIMGAAAIMFAGLTFVAFLAYRSRVMQSGAWFLTAMLTLACASALMLTTSMGALLATIAGAMLLMGVLWESKRSQQVSENLRHARGYVNRWIGPAMLVMIFGATLGVIFRGAILPEGFLGEKSLLFRRHYLQAAAGIVAAHPFDGVGPAGFQQAYMLHRVPRNPEEVQSAHAMFTDWIAAMGIAGGAWVALIIALVSRTGLRIDAHSSDARFSTAIALRVFAAIAALGIVPASIVEWPALSGFDIALRGLSAVGFVVIAMIMASVLALCSARMIRGFVAAAALVLLVHGQIEMSFFQGGSVVWLMAMVGLLGTAAAPTSMLANRLTGWIAATCIAASAMWIAINGVLPAARLESAMLDAARRLEPVRKQPDDAALALTTRREVAEVLVEAYELWPITNQPLNAAAEQLLIAAERAPRAADGTGSGPPIGLLMRAQEIAERAALAHNSISSTVLAINAHAGLGSLTGDSEHWNRAAVLAQNMTRADPLGVGAWRRLGDVLWAAGAKGEAADAYRVALRNSDNFDLDDLKQLSAEARALLQARIDEAAASASQPALE